MNHFAVICATIALLFGANIPHSPALADTEVPVQLAAKKSKKTADVYLLRGFAGVFSRGLDSMGEKLVKKGVDAQVIAHSRWERAAAEIIANRKKYGRRPVVLIGHSLGANAVIRMAKVLKKKRIRIDYMVTFAATNPDPIPTNVRKATNYYFKTDGWGKPIKGVKGYRGNLKNIDFSTSTEIGHFNIEKQPRLQRQVINNVLRFTRIRSASQTTDTDIPG